MGAIVYHIFCTVNGKCYIGQTWDTLESRWHSHKKASSRCVHLRNAIALYGESSFVRSVLTHGLTSQEDLNAAETYWIEYFDSRKNGYNIKGGGSNGKHSEKTIAKMSAAGMGKSPSAETRMKQRMAKLGKRHTPETIAKMKAAKANVSPETKAKISAARANQDPHSLSHGFSEESKAKMRAALKGNKNCLGRAISEETRAKMRASMLAFAAREKLCQ